MSHETTSDKLVYMVNQISKFFASQGESTAVSGTADHLKRFWDPRMRATILQYLAAGGKGLDPVAWQAVERLRGNHHSADAAGDRRRTRR
jgi:formate dehydrogenase subunit delta